MLETNEAKLKCEVVTCADSTRIRECFALISSCSIVILFQLVILFHPVIIEHIS